MFSLIIFLHWSRLPDGQYQSHSELTNESGGGCRHIHGVQLPCEPTRGGLKLSQEPFSTKAHNQGNFMPHPLHPSLTTLNGFLRTQHTIPGRAIGTWSIHKGRDECTMPISFMMAQTQQAHSKGIPFFLSIRVIPCQTASNYLPYSIPTLSI